MISVSIIFRASQNTAQPAPAPYNVFSKIEAVDIPSSGSFAGEPIPLSSFDVKERLDRELLVNTYWHSNTLQLFKLASRYFPVIEAILKENGVPEDFKYMALAESGLRNAVSGSNAVGFWQIIESSGKELGLEVNNMVDERYHIDLSTAAACKYLKNAHKEFGSWTLAAASYNMGKTRLRKILREQKVNSYYDLFMNDETSRYVFRIIALKEIISNSRKYGFFLDRNDLYEPIPCTTINVEQEIDDLAAFALENGTNYKTLKLLNPWLRQPYFKLKRGKTYELKLPS